jgi:regulator of nucleoside diphosphate kinase
MQTKVVAHIAVGKPQVTIDAAWYGTLHDLASAALERSPEVAALLLEELARAQLRSSGEMPADVVTIGSEVSFRYNDDGHSQTVRLVLPRDADISQGRVSVFTPIGATLLGLAEGHAMEWMTRHGERRSLTILKVREPAKEESDVTSSAALPPWL